MIKLCKKLFNPNIFDMIDYICDDRLLLVQL